MPKRVLLLNLNLISRLKLLTQLGYLKISCLPITIMSRQQKDSPTAFLVTSDQL